RDPHVHSPRVTVEVDRQSTHRARVSVLESELDLLLDVAPDTRRAAATTAAARLFGADAATKEGVEEIGERIGVAEDFVHLVFGHRPEAAALRAAAAEMDVPSALARVEAGGAAWRARLFVHPPVGAELIVLLALRRIAEDLVGHVDLLEPRFGRLVARVD